MSNNKFRWLLALIFSVGIVATTFYYTSTTGAFDIFMNGDMALKHTHLKDKCESCHVPWKGVSSTSCAMCHEDAKHPHVKEAADLACLDCHTEHQGKLHRTTFVEDRACKQCHAFDEHPETLAPKPAPDTKDDIKFSHQKHIAKGSFSPDACRMCHVKSDQGDFYIKATYANSCATCHALDEHTPDNEDLKACLTCHKDEAYVPPISRAPLKTKTIFSHQRHRDSICEDCHDMGVEPPDPETKKAENTDTADAKEDVSYEGIRILPDGTSCAECHQGPVRGACITCHSFH